MKVKEMENLTLFPRDTEAKSFNEGRKLWKTEREKLQAL